MQQPLAPALRSFTWARWLCAQYVPFVNRHSFWSALFIIPGTIAVLALANVGINHGAVVSAWLGVATSVTTVFYVSVAYISIFKCVSQLVEAYARIAP